MGGRSALRFPAMLAGLLALALGLWAGLYRIGWALPVPSLVFPEAHGPLMINGVLATLIGLERAVALERRLFYAAPLLTGLGSVALAAGAPLGPSALLVTIGSGVLLLAFVVIFRRQGALFTAAQLLGAAALVAGNFLWWYGWDILYLIPWWGSFLVLLIAAERLELTRITPLARSNRLVFAGAVAFAIIGCIASLESFWVGTLVVAGSWLALGGWLLLHDVARRNLSRKGLPRFTATCLLAGYAWLVAGSALVLFNGGLAPDGFAYDAQLHAVFLGFVLSMVFAHAPVILPAVLGRPLPFRRFFYASPILLNASVAARIGADLAGAQTVREWAGLFNVVAIGLFGISLLAVLVGSGLDARHHLRLDSSPFFP